MNRDLQEKGTGTEKIAITQEVGIAEKGKMKATWKIDRWASEEDREAGRVYSEEEALRLFGISQFTTIERNILLNIGINEFWTLICSAGGTRYDNANAQLGVGSSATAEAAAQTSLMAVRDQIAWAASTAYTAGLMRRPVTVGDASMFIYEVTTAGTSAAAEPAWPTTDGATITDGTVVWTARQRIVFVAQASGFPTFGSLQRATWRSSFGGAIANYPWNEFTVRNGAVALRSANRRVIAQGTKASGAVWELTLEIALS